MDLEQSAFEALRFASAQSLKLYKQPLVITYSGGKDSDVLLRLEIIKKAYGLVILAVSVFCFDSVLVIAAGSVVSTLIATFVNAAPNKKLLNYSYLEQVKDLLPSLGMTAAMGTGAP